MLQGKEPVYEYDVMMGGDNQYRVSLFTAQFELKSVRLTIKMDTTSKIFAIVDWDDGTTNDIPLTVIRYPRKGLKDYAVGEKVEARCTGYGYCWGVLAAIDGMYTNVFMHHLINYLFIHCLFILNL